MAEDKVVQCNTLGKIGRFGNQMFQYAVAKKYAQITGSVLQTEKWAGQEIFEGINDPIPDRKLPVLKLDEYPQGQSNIDFNGWYRYHEAMRLWTYKEIRDVFKIKQKWLDRFPRQPERKIVVHLRRGDTTKLNMAVIDISAYYKALSKLGIDPESVKIVSDSLPSKKLSFDDELKTASVEWLPDFMEMVNAKILLRSNSTFSWWAAALSDCIVYSPVVDERVGIQYSVPFVLGNYPRSMPIKYNIGRLGDIFLEDDLSLA